MWARLIDSIFGIEEPSVQTFSKTNSKPNETLKRRVIMLNRARRRYLASKIRKANHNTRTFRNIKAHQLPHRASEGDFIDICRIAGVDPQEVLKHG